MKTIKNIFKRIFSERQRNQIHYLIFMVRGQFYKGTKYYCNCCGKTFRKFLMYGNVPRQNAACPYCNSTERIRLLLYYLENETSIFQENRKILHFAPERMIEKKIKKTNNKNYITADINPANADQIIDITNIPFEENSFDFVICSHVLGHVHNEPKAIDEMYRVLKPRGTALILTLIDRNNQLTYENPLVKNAEEKLEHYTEPDLERLHGLDFKQRLQRGGIIIKGIDYSLYFDEEDKIKFSLGNKDRELIFKCVKN